MPARPNDSKPESVGGEYTQVPSTENGVVESNGNRHPDVVTELPKDGLDMPRYSGQFSTKKSNGYRTASFNLHSNPYGRCVRRAGSVTYCDVVLSTFCSDVLEAQRFFFVSEGFTLHTINFLRNLFDSSLRFCPPSRYAKQRT